jgi:SAM-dependent methyltransferase
LAKVDPLSPSSALWPARADHAPEGGKRSVDIESWFDAVSDHVVTSAPELSDLLSDYVGEARFGASVIDAEIATLPAGSRVLEIGAGSLLLSCLLQAAGYRVSALEPIGSGFSHMDRLRQLVWDFAGQQGCAPELHSIKAEQLDRDREFDYAFSINVMEHVDDVALVLRRVWTALRPGASYRFVCPNYAFPYEPHFGIPTLVSKALTGRVFRRRILASPLVADPHGTWTSLNWISVASVRRIARDVLGVEPEFDRTVLDRYVRRAIADCSFQRRHSPAVRRAFTLLDTVGILKLVPPGIQPVISCRVERPMTSA